MNLRRNVRQLPLRLAAGTFIINSGLSKWDTDEATAQHLEGFAAGAYPFLAKLDPQLRLEGSLRPTQQGLPLAKDVWLAAIGASLVIDDLVGWGRRS